jgi:hypothetical protein
MRKLAMLATVILIFVACSEASEDVTPQDIQKLSDKEALRLLECQSRKVEQELSDKETKEYVNRLVDEVLESKQKDLTVQYLIAQDGYWCDVQERKELAKEIKRQEKRQEQIALWGPPAAVENMEPGLFGGAFVGDVEYKIDSEHTGEWMLTAKAKELKVSTTATSQAELLELARTIKDKESGGFDFTRFEYFGGKKDLNQQTYRINGTVCILNSKDGLTMFGDQYPLGNAYEQAKKDLAQDDGIVFLGSQE